MDFFTPGKSNQNKELLLLRHQLGGTLGQVSIGGEKVAGLRLPGDIIVTTEKVKPQIKTMLSLAGVDIHSVHGALDRHEFTERYKTFKEAYGQEAAKR